ncbi:Protein adenylyltransferase FICD [Paramyrothecium foliicola]|nr:Protein adenylyltransferase FICD [Paramyrothecium foliicola]
MSDLYRTYGDGWSMKPGLRDEPADVTDEFGVMTDIMTDIQLILQSSDAAADIASDFLIRAMAKTVYGSNAKARKGLGLDETIALCMAVFEGQVGVEYSERSEEYQARLDRLVRQQLGPGERHVIRSRREVVQHAAAFQHLVNKIVKEGADITEDLIKETHAILVKGSSPARIREDMRSFIKNLNNELDEGARAGHLDPIAVGAKYCDRFVHIHPFRDGNGRMCRLILNAILLRYAGVVVNVGEHDQSRDEYIGTAQESREVGGHPGALATLVLRHATNTYRKMRETVRGALQVNDQVASVGKGKEQMK